MEAAARMATPDVVAALEHLTGPSRGGVSWLSASEVYIAVGDDRLIRIVPDAALVAPATLIAKMTWAQGSYAIEALDEHRLWINGRMLRTTLLRHGDTIEFGETGPMSRFRLFEKAHPIRWSLDEIAGDSLAYLRSSRKPLGQRLSWAAGDFGRRLLWETTVFFRITVILAIIGLGVLVLNQYRTSLELQRSLEEEALRLEGIASSVARAREEALRPSDLTALRDEMSQRFISNTERLEALERHSKAAARIIAQTVPSVAFLQGAYGLSHIESGQMLRHVLSREGIPVISPTGQPLLSLTGDGPVAEIQFIGTGFLLGGTDFLITNRHVAKPWESGGDPARLAAQGLEPVMLKFICYFPGREGALGVEMRVASDAADLAVLSLQEVPADVPGLRLAEQVPRAGEEVIVMGFPTGLRSMLAQSGAAFLAELEQAKDTGFWSVAERLARAGLIVPLASRGIVGQVAAEAIVYDAETTHGGSGGPVLNEAGEVIAVNAAILPEFGGSNLGVPVVKLRDLLQLAAGE